MSIQVQLEIETKLELSEEGFDALLSAGHLLGTDDQLNVYFDSNWTLAEHDATFRIRYAHGRVGVLTLKLPRGTRASARVMEELEIALDVIERSSHESIPHRWFDATRHLPMEMSKALGRLGITTLYRAGWVRNQRRRVHFDNLGEIELDRLELPDGSVVFEAEIESDDQESRVALERCIRDLDSSARPSRLSKFQRFRHAAQNGAASQPTTPVNQSACPTA